MNFSESKFWLDAAQWLCTIALAIALWLRRPGMDAALAVHALKTDVDARLSDHSRRLTAIETDMKYVATGEKLAELEGTVKQIDERTKANGHALEKLHAQLNRIEDYLRSRK